MKKLYTLIITFLILSLVSFSQISNNVSLDRTEVIGKTKKSNHVYSSLASKSTPIWEEDFSAGIPVTWTLNSNAPWVWRGPSTTPNTSVGSQGAYMTNQTPIASSTQQNGFVIFDSDYYDNGGIQGQFGFGNYPTPHEGLLMTDTIDLTGYTDVTLKMHSYFRTFMGQAFVNFYVNGAMIQSVQVHSLLAVNASSATDDIVLVRIPTAACNTSGVQMEFDFDGITQSNANGSGYYFWMIDDLELIETPSYLLSLVAESANYGGWNTTPFSEGFGLDYTFKPLNHAYDNPYKFEATFSNAGANDLNNVVLNATVTDAFGSQVYSGTSSPNTIVVLDTISIKTTTDFVATSMGVYDFSFWGSADSFPYTDTSYMQAVVTDTVYGRDKNNPEGSWRVGRQCGGLQLGNIFDVYVSDELTSVSAFLTGYSSPGADMFGVLYEVDTTGGALSFIYLDQTDDYTIQPADTNNWVHIGFDGGIQLSSGQYMIAIGGYANPVDTFGIHVSGDAPVSMSRIQDNGCNLGSQAFGFWYWISTTPMIRMNFGEVSVSSIKENIFSGKLTIYPNPSKGIFNIDLIDVNDGDYLISVSNILGEEVYFNSKSVVSTTSTTIDLSDLEKGIYMLNVQNGNAFVTEKLIIK